MISGQVVANITGYCQSAGNMPMLTSVDLGYNPGPGLHVLSNKHFNKLSAILSLYLWSSEIQYMEDNQVFDPIAPTLQSLDMSNNFMQRLPDGTLDSIIASAKPRFSIALQGKMWLKKR